MNCWYCKKKIKTKSRLPPGELCRNCDEKKFFWQHAVWVWWHSCEQTEEAVQTLPYLKPIWRKMLQARRAGMDNYEIGIFLTREDYLNITPVCNACEDPLRPNYKKLWLEPMSELGAELRVCRNCQSSIGRLTS